MNLPKAQHAAKEAPAVPTMDSVNPLSDPTPADVPLPSAPLVIVITQIKFSEVLNVEKIDVVTKFQEAISGTYGNLTREVGMPFPFLIQGGPLQQRPQPMTHWRFSDSPADWSYRCTLTSQFMTLECRHYTSRDDYFARLEQLLQSVALHIVPHTVQRIGVRYVNRITGQELKDAHLLVRPEIAGVVATPMASMVRQSVTEMVFALEGSTHLVARVGLLPPNTVIDAGIAPINERGFMLDLDVYSESPISFDAKAIASQAKQFAERSYTFFRWAVTPEFLQRYGGKP